MIEMTSRQNRQNDEPEDNAEMQPEDINAALEFVKNNSWLADIIQSMNEVNYEDGEYDLRLEQTIQVKDLSYSGIIAELERLNFDDDEAFGIDFGIEIDVNEYNNLVEDADLGKLPTLPVLTIINKNEVATPYMLGRVRGIKRTVDGRTVIEVCIEVVEYNGVIANIKNFGFTGLPYDMVEKLPFVKRICDVVEPDVWYKTTKDLVYDYDAELDEPWKNGLVIPKGTSVKATLYDQDEVPGGGINFETVVFRTADGEFECEAGFFNDESVSSIYGMIN